GTAFAAPCLDCPGGGGGGPFPDPRPPLPPSHLVIENIHCAATQELGVDEVYFVVLNQIRNHSVNCGKGAYVPLNIGPIAFNSAVSVQVWEDDGNRWIDPNDLMGTFTVSDYEKTLPQPRQTTVANDGAVYDIQYRVY